MYTVHTVGGDNVLTAAVSTAAGLQSTFPSMAAAYQLDGSPESFHAMPPPQEMVPYNPGPYTGPYTGMFM